MTMTSKNTTLASTTKKENEELKEMTTPLTTNAVGSTSKSTGTGTSGTKSSAGLRTINVFITMILASLGIVFF